MPKARKILTKKHKRGLQTLKTTKKLSLKTSKGPDKIFKKSTLENLTRTTNSLKNLLKDLIYHIR